MVRLADLHEEESAHLLARAAAMSPVTPAPWITPGPLSESTVAIVSTAGLHRRTDPPFAVGAVDYRILPGDVDFGDVVLSHISTNFDRSGFQQDPNISFPADRLREMATAGEIGGVSQWHYSFMGAQPNHAALQDTGEEVGRLLAADGVDVALLIPVWPICSGAVGALANYIERAGVATASISLVREQTEAVHPPRALWVPFALGRPLGSSEDPEFQKNVIRASLAMLQTATEPTIEDYPIEAPFQAGPQEWACPLSLPVVQDPTHRGRVLAEIARLKPWALETRSAPGRTLFGVTGAGPDQVELVASALGNIADTGDLASMPEGDIDWAFEMPMLIRHLADDLRTFYHEAIAAQPGPAAPNHDALTHWIFSGTALGDCLQTIAHHLTEPDDFILDLIRGFLIPEGHYQHADGSTPDSHWGG